MNLKAFLLTLLATVSAVHADCRGGYCNLDKINYLVDVAAYEGLTTDHVADLDAPEKAALRAALEQKVAEIKAAGLSENQAKLIQAGKIAAVAALVATTVLAFYTCYNTGKNSNSSYNYADIQKVFDAMSKKFDGAIPLFNLGRDTAAQLGAEAWSAAWKKWIFAAVASCAGMLGSTFGIGYAAQLLNKQEVLDEQLVNVQASLALVQ